MFSDPPPTPQDVKVALNGVSLPATKWLTRLMDNVSCAVIPYYYLLLSRIELSVYSAYYAVQAHRISEIISQGRAVKSELIPRSEKEIRGLKLTMISLVDDKDGDGSKKWLPFPSVTNLAHQPLSMGGSLLKSLPLSNMSTLSSQQRPSLPLRPQIQASPPVLTVLPPQPIVSLPPIHRIPKN